MITLVNFEIAKLLKEKGFDEQCPRVVTKENTHHLVSGIEHTIINGITYIATINSRLSDAIYSAPTIAEVVMWLYEKHSLWILPLPTITGYFAYKIIDVQLDPKKPIERPPYNDVSANDYNTPTEAYTEAIKYCLTNLIE